MPRVTINEAKVLATMREAYTYSGLDTIRYEKVSEIGDVHYVEIGFPTREIAMKFQMAIAEVLK